MPNRSAMLTFSFTLTYLLKKNQRRDVAELQQNPSGKEAGRLVQGHGYAVLPIDNNLLSLCHIPAGVLHVCNRPCPDSPIHTPSIPAVG